MSHRLLPLLALLALVALPACGGSDEPAAPNAAGTASPEATTAQPAAASDLAGQYAVTGTNADGTAYRGTLTVAQQDGAYTFAWQAGESYTGVGVQQGDFIAVGFGMPGCGAAAYQTTASGLDGVWALPGGASGTEQATRSGGTAGSAAGQYATAGTNLGGAPYTGTLDVTPQGAGYALAWGGNAPSAGIGLADGTDLGTTQGPADCGLATYRVQADGSLAGTWASPGLDGTGTEQATRL